MPEKHWVGTEDDFTKSGTKIIVEVEGIEIGVFYVSVEYFAMANYCVHQSGPLCEGGLGGQITVDPAKPLYWRFNEDSYQIHCPWHGWMFDIRTGECVDDRSMRAPTYEVEIEDSEVYVVR